MRSVCLAMIIGVTAVIIFPAHGSSAATRTIVCRGSSANPPGTYNAGIGPSVRLNYTKAATTPQNGLNPGECSWTNSPIEPGAPTTLCASGAGGFLSLAFKNTGDIYLPSKKNVFDLVKATWLQRYYSDSGPLFALDTTADIPVNCLYVQGDAKDFILPTPRARAHPSPRGSGRPQ
jgi:hypothetical protein